MIQQVEAKCLDKICSMAKHPSVWIKFVVLLKILEAGCIFEIRGEIIG